MGVLSAMVGHRLIPLRRRGSVLVLVLVTLAFAAAALVRFIDQASTDLIVEARRAQHDELRVRAYSALQVVLGVLAEYHQIDGGLQSPAQGWGDPRSVAGLEGDEEAEFSVTFTDESARFPLNQAADGALQEYFEGLGLEESQAEDLVRAWRDWTTTPTEGSGGASPFASRDFDYERRELPYTAPRRAVRTWGELAAIAGFDEAFFDSAGQPKARFRALVSTATLRRVAAVNVNGAPDVVLEHWLGLTPIQVARLRDSLNRPGLKGRPAYFKSLEEAEAAAGGKIGAQPVGVNIETLTIDLVARRGGADFPLRATVRIGRAAAPPAAAERPATPRAPDAPAAAPGRAGEVSNRPDRDDGLAVAGTPFTLLEIEEGPATFGRFR